MRTCRNTAITLKRNSLNISPGGERFTDCKFHSIQSTCCELRRVLMCETACGLILNFTASSLPERVLLRISRTISAFKWVDHCLSPRRPILTALAMFSTSTLAQDTLCLMLPMLAFVVPSFQRFVQSITSIKITNAE